MKEVKSIANKYNKFILKKQMSLKNNYKNQKYNFNH